MFTESISELMNQSSIGSAEKRAAQIEAMISSFNARVQEIKIPEVKVNEFSEFSKILDSTKTEDVKFRLSPPLDTQENNIESIAKAAAHKYSLDESLLFAVIKQESGFNSKAVSSAGAKGLMQLMPGTAKSLGVSDVFDPVQNINGGAKHLRGLLNRYKGNLILALAAYNAGEGNVDKYGGVPPFKETQNYVKSILANYLQR